MSIQKVRSALAQAFISGAFFSATKISWPNVLFSPPADAWASVFFLPAQPEVASLGTTGKDELNGLMQIDLNYPLNSGEKEIIDKAEAVKAAFKPGFGFTYEGQTAIVRSSGYSDGRKVGAWHRISVSIFFYAHINR